MVYFRKRLTPGILGEINEMIVRDAKERQAKAAESDHDDRPKGCPSDRPLDRPLDRPSDRLSDSPSDNHSDSDANNNSDSG